MHVMQSAPGAETIIDGKKYVYFVGTGYLGLHGHPEVIEAACRATRQYGIGSATSREGYGNNPCLLEVEERSARFFGTEEAFYYVSGYCGNAVMAQALRDDFDLFLVDDLAHYSVFDGVLQGNKRYVTFRHLDTDDLSAQLKKQLKPGERPLVMSDGIFPVSGEIPPVDEYLKVLSRYDGAGICLDDAHAVAVLGESGRGTYEHFGLKGETLYYSGTLSKAVGGHGGIIPGRRSLIRKIHKASHLYNGATPPPVPAAAATAKALEIIMSRPELLASLRANVRMLKQGLNELGLDTDDTPVPIICLRHAEPERMEKIHRSLMDRGIIVAYVGSYAGVEGVIRIAVFATHTPEMLNRLISEIARLL
jgi:8-amino-7-oxononanoate synthase